MRVRLVLFCVLILLPVLLTPPAVQAEEVYIQFDNILPSESLPENCSWAAIDELFDDGPDYYKVATVNLTSSWNTFIIHPNTSASFLDFRFYDNSTLFSSYRIYIANITILSFEYPSDSMQFQVSSAVRGSVFTMSFWEGNVSFIPLFTLIPVTTVTEYVTVTQSVTVTETVTLTQNITQYIIIVNTSHVYHNATVTEYLPMLHDYSIWLPLTGCIFAIGCIVVFHLWNQNNNQPLPPRPSAKEMLNEIFNDEKVIED